MRSKVKIVTQLEREAIKAAKIDNLLRRLQWLEEDFQTSRTRAIENHDVVRVTEAYRDFARSKQELQEQIELVKKGEL